MPRWAIVLTVVPLGICLGCVVLGFIAFRHVVDEVVPDLQDDVSDEMAAVLSEYVSRRIEASARAAGGLDAVDKLVFRPVDLNVNNLLVSSAPGAPSEVGIETGPEGTVIYGIETRISPSGVTLVLPGVTYSAVPVVEEGRIELTEIEAGENLLGFIFSDESFEQAIEGGLNDALRDHGLVPVALSLRSGLMTVDVEPMPCLGGAGGLGGCPPATPERAVAR